MKIIIQIPDDLNLTHVDECFPNRILQYELIGNKLVAWVDHISEITIDLIEVTFKHPGGIFETFVISSNETNNKLTNTKELNVEVIK